MHDLQFGTLHVGSSDDEHDRAEQERQIFAEIFSAIHVGIHVWHVEDESDAGSMRLLYANAATQAASGIAPETIVGRTLRDVFPPFMATPFPAIYLDVALGGAARPLGDVVYRDDRVEESIFEARLFPLPDRCVGVAFTDVTRERAAEASGLQTLESMNDAFFAFDNEWMLTYLNPQSESLLHQPPEALLGRSYWEVFPEAADLKFGHEYKRAFREQVPVEFEEFYPPLQTWFAVRACPTPQGMAVYFNDVTARHELEARLLQTQKLETVGRLAGGLAHDFNNLLTVIDGYTSVIQSKLDPGSPSIARELEQIGGASRRAGALTAKLLAFSRKQMLRPTVADVNEIVLSALELARPLLSATIHVHQRLSPDAGNAVVDVGQIEQVLLNLAINARDAMPAGGNLFVTTERVTVDEGSSLELRPGPYVALSLHDDGTGMDEQTRKQVFDPFFTTKGLGQGTGLGLATAYGTIKQSGGHIDVKSEPGDGTTVTFYLPRSDSDVPVPVPEPAPRSHRAGGERILVVEDEEIVRGLVIELLESQGYVTAAAAGPEEALALCAGAPFDLLVTDVVMPDGDGPALARAAVQRVPAMRVLYVSGFTPQSIDELAIAGVETAFLGKPFGAGALAAHVRDLLDRPAR